MKRVVLSDGRTLEFRRAPLALNWSAAQARHVQVPCELVVWTGPVGAEVGASYSGQSWRECFRRLRSAGVSFHRIRQSNSPDLEARSNIYHFKAKGT